MDWIDDNFGIVVVLYVMMLGFVLTICSSQVYPTYANTVQDTVSLSGAPPEAEIISHEIYNDVKSVVQQLAAGLVVGAEHVYGILVTQQVVKAIVFLIVLIFSIILFGVLYKIIIFITKHTPEPEPPYIILSILLGFTGGILFMVGITHIDVIVTGLIKEILETIR